MPPLKAQGPDRYAACFFKQNWATVADEVSSVVLDILNLCSMTKELNSTNIALIPKIISPSCVMEFRPISLCNVLYKIVSKVLAYRLKIVLLDVISFF